MFFFSPLLFMLIYIKLKLKDLKITNVIFKSFFIYGNIDFAARVFLMRKENINAILIQNRGLLFPF